MRNKKKILEFLNSFISQIAHCNVLRKFKDYYPKVIFFFIYIVSIYKKKKLDLGIVRRKNFGDFNKNPRMPLLSIGPVAPDFSENKKVKDCDQ